MSAGWVAGTVRARGMARRALGADAAARLAACRSLLTAQQLLRSTPFRDAAEPGLSLTDAQDAVAAAVLWDLRVLAGWLPPDGVRLLRLLACWFEIANVDELLQALAGRPAAVEYQLGALATAWPRLRTARTTTELRVALAASAWGDPGAETGREIRFWIRNRWAERLAASQGQARTWATAAMALLRPAEAVPPRRAGTARSPSAAADVIRPTEPWQAEADWWRKVEREGRSLLRSSAADSGPVLGAVAVMAADARRVRAALAAAARGGLAPEDYDALV
jgi:hypothetical protein